MTQKTESQSNRSSLLPDRHPTPDFFICDVTDAVPKGDMAGMEHPLFSLSTKPDMRTRRYEHNNSWMEIRPSAEGLATVHDRDILIYCISQLMAAINAGRRVSRTLRFSGAELLTATNRMTTGRGYELLRLALERLAGTRITTNIMTGDIEITRGFGLIDSYEIVRRSREGRMQEIEVTLSDWVFNAIESHEVLTLHRNYFRLRKPIERRLYELARKHCGRKPEWRISLDLLRHKVGSASTLKEFRRLIRKVIEDNHRDNHLPDYTLQLESRNNSHDMVIFTNRGTIPVSAGSRSIGAEVRELLPDTYHEARLQAPGWDVYELERQWRSWLNQSEVEPPRKPDAAFVGFCRMWSNTKQR